MTATACTQPYPFRDHRGYSQWSAETLPAECPRVGKQGAAAHAAPVPIQMIPVHAGELAHA